MEFPRFDLAFQPQSATRQSTNMPLKRTGKNRRNVVAS